MIAVIKPLAVIKIYGGNFNKHFHAMVIFLIVGFTSIDLFTVMSAVSVLMFNFEIITSVGQDHLMTNAVFVLR